MVARPSSAHRRGFVPGPELHGVLWLHFQLLPLMSSSGRSLHGRGITSGSPSSKAPSAAQFIEAAAVELMQICPLVVLKDGGGSSLRKKKKEDELGTSGLAAW